MPKHIPLSEAALRLGLTYDQVRQRLFRKELPGGRDRYGRFYVDADALPAARAEGEAQPALPENSLRIGCACRQICGYAN
jgi:hypothetical protein